MLILKEYLSEIVEKGNTYIERQVKKPDGSYVTTYQYCDLKNYNITFQLGWLDVQTEALLEFNINNNEIDIDPVDALLQEAITYYDSKFDYSLFDSD